ncbi:lysophospholipase, putative [Plasmodium gaboni]|uniref:Lysophospholipase, putative n=1 Tax=Plasmodium gaboni TaxID=647221 RepID=A0ABY1UVR9_9APIC|nr:lysophospholipase, putative [Plasmodium gaboni]
MTESDIIYDENTKVRAVVSSFCNKDGLNIKSYSWVVKKALGIIILVHGLGSHIKFGFLKQNANIISNDHAVLIDGDNYYIYEGSWIEKLNKNGYSVYGLDLQGHGESDGYQNLKLHINHYDDYIHDVIEYIERVYQSNISKNEKKMYITDNGNIEKNPIYLVGYSMGANIILRALQLLNKSNDNLITKLNIKAFISLAGMISIKHIGSVDSYKYKYIFLPVIKMLSYICPNYRLRNKNRGFKRFPYINDLIYFDELRYKKGVTNKLAYEVIKSVYILKKYINDIPENIPILFIHSREDSVCAYEEVLSFFNNLYNTNKEIYTLENMDHVVTLEPGNEKALNKMLSWIKKYE